MLAESRAIHADVAVDDDGLAVLSFGQALALAKWMGGSDDYVADEVGAAIAVAITAMRRDTPAQALARWAGRWAMVAATATSVVDARAMAIDGGNYVPTRLRVFDDALDVLAAKVAVARTRGRS